LIGTTISHYRVVGKLGEGGMGIVYLAEDIVLGRRVAIKTLITKRGGEDQHFRARFLREARAVSALSHPHIATIYDYGESEAMPYIVMELIEGPTLSDLIRQESLTLPRIITIIRQVAEALGEAHRQGIIHRDIKPSNVATNKRGDVKVLDFGLAKQLDLSHISDPEGQTLLHTQTREGVIVGTPMYLSPEQALGVDIDARSDLFSLGALLYECIAGKPPFFGNSPVEICARVLRDDPPPPSQLNPQVPRPLDQVTLKALAKKPEARYQTAEEMIAALDEVQASLEGDTHDRTVTRLMRSSAGTQPTGAFATLSDIFSRPRLSIGYVAGGLLLVALLGVGIWRLTRPRVHTPNPEAQRLYDRAVEAMRESAYFRGSKILAQSLQEDDDFALAHARLAECWTELDSSDKAQSELIRTLTLVPDPSVLPQVDSLRLQAVTKTVQRDFAKAADDYRVLVSAVPANEKAFALFDLGRAYEKSQQLSKAIESYQQSTQLDPRRAAAFLRLGVLFGQSAKYNDAYNAFDQAYKLFDIDTNIEGVTEVLLQRGVVLGLQAQLAEARAQLQQALEKSAVLENKDKRIKVLLNLSNTEIIAGNPDQAQEYSKQAVELAKANGLDALTMQGLIDIGNAYLNKGNFESAEQNYTEALRLADLYKGDRSKSRALFQLASLKSQQGDVEGVRKYFQLALPFFEKGGYRKEIFSLYLLLGRAETSAGTYDQARQRFEEVRTRAQQVGDQLTVGLAEEGLGSVFSELQNVPEALRHYDECYKIYKSLNARINVGFTANNRALQWWQLSDYEKARVDINEALQIAEPGEGKPNLQLDAATYVTRSRMALSSEQFSDAIADGNKAIQISATKFKSVDVRANFTICLAEARSGRAATGRKNCETALTLARTLPDYALLSLSLLANAEAALLAGDAQTALANATEAQERFSAAQQRESEWRGLLIQSRAAQKLGDNNRSRELMEKVRTSLSALEQSWGNENYRQYVTRRDVKTALASLN
jgi:tetratricopeptide (TPR) repeat protein/predicted Ser/Thr protein kinase